jgi:uncharacterized membrane protein
MRTNRLEAFSDGVIAILITIMVLELKVPHGEGLAALREAAPSLLIYLLSFVYLAIYWNNHHHLCHLAERVDGRILWANAHLLFWLSLVPFTTAWIGEHHMSVTATAVYGVVLLLSGLAYLLLQSAIIAQEGPNSRLKDALGRDVKGKLSVLLYVAAVGIAFADPRASTSIYVIVALMWLVPDRRIASRLRQA